MTSRSTGPLSRDPRSGWIMRKTGGVLAPALFHAGVDMLIIADAFVAFGIAT
jgi:hypothetical protein